MHRLVALAAAVSGLYVIQKIVEFRKAVKAVKYVPLILCALVNLLYMILPMVAITRACAPSSTLSVLSRISFQGSRE